MRAIIACMKQLEHALRSDNLTACFFTEQNQLIQLNRNNQKELPGSIP